MNFLFHLIVSCQNSTINILFSSYVNLFFEL